MVPARPYKPRDKTKVEVSVQIAGTSVTIEILQDGQRVASHQRLHNPQAVSTVTEHKASA